MFIRLTSFRNDEFSGFAKTPAFAPVTDQFRPQIRVFSKNRAAVGDRLRF